MSNRKQGKGFLLGALAGSIAGSVAALLLAPKAGKELRHDISEGAHKVREQAASTASQVGETTGRIAKQARDQAVQFADKTKLTVTGLRLRITGSEETKLAGIHSDLDEKAAEIHDADAVGTGSAADLQQDDSERLALPNLDATAETTSRQAGALEEQVPVGSGRHN
jgi:gas vesicle protein